MTKGQLRELELLKSGPQPAYAGHGNRARAGVQNRLVLDLKFARYLPTATEATTVEITEDGLRALARSKPSCAGCGCTDRPLGRVTINTALPGATTPNMRYRTWACSPACTARILVGQGWAFEDGFTPHGVLASDLKVRLWDAVNGYAQACGGDTSSATASGARMDAVVAVESVLDGRHREHPVATVRREEEAPR